MMKIYLIFVIIIKLIYSVQYNQLCTFSFGTCNWSIGRRWHITSLDNGDKVLIADAESKEDKRIGFTDAIMSSWLQLSPLCSFDIRLTFQYYIENENDLIEIYFIEKNRTRMISIGQWKSRTNINNSSENNDQIWQQGNVTFKAAEEFRIDIEIRHLPNKKNNPSVWFGIDDILIENCPIAIVNTTSNNLHTTEILTTTSISWSTKLYSNESNTTLFNIPYWKLDDLSDEQLSSSPGQTLLTLILYLLCALIALTLLIILFSIIIFTYRKHCCPSSSSMMNHRCQLDKTKQNNRIGIQIENIDRDNQTIKTMNTTVRPCFE
ncbi:unnamed protein product [Rotaria sp. Silwood1]|nr:unnamed protein product [Rotaria sp. Silwood1]CAF1391060.1 unnamed protein product [Rotaria sp. Silwood1]CAF3526307.1 unnamed protein product [Rotaria sp. Silwood1]CAF3599981.1 unnamed protein product [Rotaria sp. Silwood1]CAF3624175.1 unnamed protein product [Rotaria sp. Silwood1]